MLLNPYQKVLATLPGSRMLVESMGLLGIQFPDLKLHGRTWTISNLFAPLAKRHLGGIRIKAVDQKGFCSFCNQRDLELLLGLAKPGEFCPWTSKEYPEINSREFFGLCVDDDDLEDDLYERELELRGLMAASPQYPSVIPYGYTMPRRIHLSAGRDVEDLDMMLYDADPETGYGPDNRFETMGSRWTRVERSPLRWEAA